MHVIREKQTDESFLHHDASMNCAICTDLIEDFDLLGVVLGKKGVLGVLSACDVRGRSDVQARIELLQTSGQPVSVHKICRKRLIDLRNLNDDEKPPPAKKTRSSDEAFNWKTCCLFCGCPSPENSKKQVCLVQTIELRQNILDVCRLRPNDENLTAVAHRVQNVIDLVAAKARYHKVCSSGFYKVKQSAEELEVNRDEKAQLHELERKPGKPKDLIATRAFDSTCDWLESTAEPLFLHEVEAYMANIAGDHMWSRRYIQEQLLERYGDHVEITNEGYRNIVRLKDMARWIINDQWYRDRKPTYEEEKRRIVLAAAKIIKEDIREMNYDKSFYPDEISIADPQEGKKWIPKSLNVFLENMIESEKKQNSIGQCLVSAVRPRSAILPVPFGVGVEMDHIFGSRWNTSQLYDLGFSISYDEVNRYKQSVLQSRRVEDIIPDSDSAFTQWTGDNADSPTRTLDGKNTFHGMGCIAVSTPIANSTDPHSSLVPHLPLIKRMGRLPVQNLTHDKGIPIVPFTGPKKVDYQSSYSNLEMRFPNAVF